MKLFIPLIFLLLLCSNITKAATLELNADNLTLLALKQAKPTVVKSYARYLTMKHQSKEYFKVIKNKEKKQLLIDKVHSDLLVKMKTASHEDTFIVGKTIKLFDFNKQKNTFSITSFSKDVEFLYRSKKQIKGLPNHFLLLYSNLELLSSVKLNPELIPKFDQLMKNKTAYIEAKLVFAEFQNQQDFQVVIKNISVFSDSTKKLLLAKAQEKRDNKTIINSWLLANGYTNPLVGLHAFSLFGSRLQDMMIATNLLNNKCTKTKKIGIHQVVECSDKFTQNINIRTTYVGAKLAKLEVIALKLPSSHEKDKTINRLSTALKKQKQFFTNGNQKWNKYTVDFEYYADAFTEKGSLQNVFNFGKQEKQHAVIFTMMSQATKKLIKEDL